MSRCAAVMSQFAYREMTFLLNAVCAEGNLWSFQVYCINHLDEEGLLKELKEGIDFSSKIGRAP